MVAELERPPCESLARRVRDLRLASSFAGSPLRVHGKPVAGAGIKSALLGTAKRKNGKLQVTYKGHLLYLFAEDQKPGQTTGEGLNNFGAKWYALTPKGAVIDRD